MAEDVPNSPQAEPGVAKAKVSRWWIGGPLLVATLVVAGMLGWTAWKHHQFEKERTETSPHVVEDLKLKLLWIPAGTFLMGTEDEAEWLKSLKGKYNDVKPSGWSEWKARAVTDESPATVVTLTKGFYLGETEVTQAQWETVMGSNPSSFKGAKRPVETVSWEDCVEFCRKLTERERASGRIGPRQVFRLPTEAEWEYACRAGSRGEWSFGDDERRLGEFAWFEDNSGGETHEVATKRANSWGLLDMHGNVWEWCADWYEGYSGGRVTDPTGAFSDSGRVCRGGSWNLSSDRCRSARRGRYSPGDRNLILGFRLALSPIP